MSALLNNREHRSCRSCRSCRRSGRFSGNDFYFKYPNGDELYSVIALYLAEDVSGKMKITDGESNALKFFGKDEIPTLESRAAKIIEWLIREKNILEQ